MYHPHQFPHPRLVGYVIGYNSTKLYIHDCGFDLQAYYALLSHQKVRVFGVT